MRAFLKKIDLFNLFNAVMAVFCIVILSLNYIGCNVLSSQKLDCNIQDNKFSYLSKGNEIIVTKNDNFIGKIKFKDHMLFRSSWKFPGLRCNAIVLAGKIVAAGIAAAVAGSSVGAAIIAEVQGAIAAIGGAAAAGGVACIELPGGAAVSATLGGAGEAAAAAAAADAAIAAGGAAAVISSIVVPILIGAGVAAGLA